MKLLGCCGALAALLAIIAPVAAQRPAVTAEMAPYVLDDAEVFALTNARIIDGSGAAPVDGQTVVLRDGLIEAVGGAESVEIPAGARVLDLAGKTVLPGLVQLHEHLWTYAGAPLSVPVTYPRLYLAGGVTSIRTAGSYHPYADLRAKRDIDAGRAVGPWMDLTIYTAALATPPLETQAEVERYLGFWLDSGFTSVKVYSYSGPEMVRWIVDSARSRGAKVIGHLCNVSYRQAAEMGIDNIEHGFAFTPDFVPDIVEGKAKGRACAESALASMDFVDIDSPEVDALIADLVASGITVTSTLPALEDLLPQGGSTAGHDLLPDFMRAYHADYRDKVERGEGLVLSEDALRKSIGIELKFLRAGGRLASGTDSTVPSGGIIAGYSAARQLELMVENGFSPLEAIRVSTLNSAISLGRADLVGTVQAGKQADLLVVDGDPATRISDVRNVEIVFKQGIAYDPHALRESVRGKIGIH
ncbi:amidohydrolase family protein [Luteimonas sp. R10]|uniref:amidohydrolase family protein n=1 Tax=Luteimonas sp. R10 TaxID=3108176 RepID=UPI003090CD2B|nr:amidohydrolase family protein [Luteimonas sp. R10]